VLRQRRGITLSVLTSDDEFFSAVCSYKVLIQCSCSQEAWRKCSAVKAICHNASIARTLWEKDWTTILHQHMEMGNKDKWRLCSKIMNTILIPYWISEFPTMTFWMINVTEFVVHLFNYEVRSVADHARTNEKIVRVWRYETARLRPVVLI